MSVEVRIYFDGGSRGNPGPAAGAAYADADGGVETSIYLPHATNNEAEYHGFLLAVNLAKENEYKNVLFLGDSQLVVSQVKGEWKVKSEVLAQLLARAKVGLKSLPSWRIEWIARAENSIADRLANQAMDDGLGIMPFSDEWDMPETNPIRPDIQRLNGLGKKAEFKDIRGLKVGGMDEFSKMSETELSDRIKDLPKLKTAFQERLKVDPVSRGLDTRDQDKLAMNALRWVARGLKSDLAIKKILIDHETAQKFRDKK